MKIKSLFERDIFRSINGVVKAHQLDDASVWQELDEFIVTRELDKHFRNFFSNYTESILRSSDPDVSGRIGIWVSGFFGSGKSHFIKVLSYLLQNKTHEFEGQRKQAIDFFEEKIQDATVFGDIKRAVSESTDVILFNIDTKAVHKSGRDAILQVFLKVFNEMLGYSGDHPHVAHMERYLESKGKLKMFHEAYRNATGVEWIDERDAYLFNSDEVINALHQTLEISRESAEKWIDGAEDSFALTIENLARWVKQYLDSKENTHRIIFLVDEVGQFIGSDTHLMLNLQTIVEELGSVCQGRAWIVVTSQEDIDAVLGEMKKSKAKDFSKIQGRFRTRLSLSSANVDEVIQARLLAKRPEVIGELTALFNEKGDIIKHQLSFTQCGMTLKNYKDSSDFVKNYPFAPYQFQLVQKIFESIRKAGATGLHLSRGERSILDAFQSAGKQVGLYDIGILVPLYRFYPSIESFLDTMVKRTIDQAMDNPSLEPFDINLLQVLFLIRYVEEMKGTVDNLVTLCLDQIDADRLALRQKIEAGLLRLEKETLISRNGDLYFFLTNEERDINREIKSVELTGSEESRLLGQLIFTEALKDQRKHRYSVNKMDFTFNRICDFIPVGTRYEGALQVSFITPLYEDYDRYENVRCAMESTAEGGSIIVRLGNNEILGHELSTFIQTDKYGRYKNQGSLPDTTKRILRDIAEDNAARRNRIVKLLSEMIIEADYFANGQKLTLKSSTPMGMLDESLEYLIENSFTKMSYLKHVYEEPLREIEAILRSNDIGQQNLALQAEEGNKLAVEEVRNYLTLTDDSSHRIVLYDLLEKKFTRRPYGWPVENTLVIIARLIVLCEINLNIDGKIIPINEVYEAIMATGKRRKIIITRRRTTTEENIRNARKLSKDLFQEMGPEGEDALFKFYQTRLKNWREAIANYKLLADTGEYPGKNEIDKSFGLVERMLGFPNSYSFFEKLIGLKDELLEHAENFLDLNQFFTHQKTIWEKLRKSYNRFQLNKLELARDEQAGPALRRIQEIMNARKPYGLIRESEELIGKVEAINTMLIQDSRKSAIAKIENHIATLRKDVESINGSDELSRSCVLPLENIISQIESQESLAHISQLESEAGKRVERALEEINKHYQIICEMEQAQTDALEQPKKIEHFKKRRVIRISEISSKPYLETKEDVDTFIQALKKQLDAAIARNEKVKLEK